MKSERLLVDRLKGDLSKTTKLTGKDEIIKDLPRKKVSVATIAINMDVNRLTPTSYTKSRKLRTG